MASLRHHDGEGPSGIGRGQLPWEEAHRPLIGRLAGGFWLAGLVPGFVDPGGLNNKLFANLSTPQILDWAAHNQTGISVSALVGTFTWALWAVAAVLTISLLRGRGIFAALRYISVASGIAITWITAGIMFALAETAQQAGSDAGVAALFKLAHNMSATDGFSFAGMVASVSALIWSTRLLPAPLAWLGGLGALYHAGVGDAVQLLLTGTVFGITGPLSLIFSIPWILAIGITLIVKPVWAPRSRPALQPAAST